MEERIAVMDLGTNVFHLLIAEAKPPGFMEIIHLQEAVKLGEGGINKGIIQPAAFQRGVSAMQRFHDEIEKTKASQVRAVATSALRNASNGADFVAAVKVTAAINIEVIDGEQEAAYIYRGIRASGCLNDEASLIIDIGGGSVEFIIADNARIFWKQSFEVGAARLMDLFHKVDPIPNEAVRALTQYLDEKLAPLFEAVKGSHIDQLVGSSGAFETFAEVIEIQADSNFDLRKIKSYIFDAASLASILNWFIQSSHQQRLSSGHIPPVRVDMIVVSSVFTRYILQKLNIESVLMSTYSLKEGVLAELMGL